LSTVRARKEILLCGGSIDTPKLLLLSGIGPAEELAPLGINVVHNLPGVGKRLRDHYGTYIASQMDAEFSDREQFEKSTADKRPPRDDWLQDTTGYYTEHYNSMAWGFLRDEEILKTKEFASLDPSQQEFLRNPEVPLYELLPVWLSSYIKYIAPLKTRGPYSWLSHCLPFSINEFIKR